MVASARSRVLPATGIKAARRGTERESRVSVLDPIITMNAEGVIQSASDSVEQVFGWTPTELFGRNVKVLIPEPRRSALDRYLDRYRLSDKSKALNRARRFDAVRKDGSAFQIELSVSRANLPPHSAPFFIGIIRDVSREIDVGLESVEARSRLQRLITEQTRALATANLRLHLTDRLASIGALAAGLGHDMNNVLLPVRARLNALEHAGITGAALRHVRAVRRSIAYLQHLSDGLHFLVVDPDRPRSASDGEGVTELASWWSQVGGLLRKALPRHVTMQVSLAGRLPPVRVAPHWLTQAVLNLIINAGEAIPVGRRNGRARLWAIVAPDGQTIRLGVTDNGRGMTQAVRRRALDLFFTTKNRAMGTGLGLPLARKVAERAGGDIEIKSEPGHGTTVTLILPISMRRPSAARRQRTRKRVAAVSVCDHRVAALMTQLLVAANVQVRPAEGVGPGDAQIWITKPTLGNLRKAETWYAARRSRGVVLIGTPSRRLGPRWRALGATVVPEPGEFEAMRHAVGKVVLGEPGEGAE